MDDAGGHGARTAGSNRDAVTPERILFAGMFLSAGLVLWFGRNLSFSGDELSLISLVAGLEPSELIEPYVGHLVPISLVAYRLVLEVFGASEYAPFQVLTLLSIFLLAWILFAWGKLRVPPWVALAPALLMLIFPQDLLHYLAGNGFVIVFALACGLGSLYAFEQGSRKWDLAAFGLIVAGLLTYTVAAAFAIGVLVAALVERNWNRLWVAGLPLIGYAIWRLTLAAASSEIEDTPPDFDNLLLLPAWVFQSIGGALAALLGIGFDFLGLAPRDPATATRYLGPTLAIVFLAALGAVVATGRARRNMIVVIAIAVALYASQNVVWASFADRPGPGETRYLYPTTLVVLMLGLEMARGLRWDRRMTSLLLGVTAVSLVGAIGYLAIDGKRDGRTSRLKAEVLAVALLESTGNPPPVGQQPRDALRKSFDPVDGSRFGYPGFTEQEILTGERQWAPSVDRFLAGAERLGLRPVENAVPFDCRAVPAAADRPTGKVFLPARGAILFSSQLLELRLGRYGETASWELGPLGPDRPALLRLEPDDGTRSWFVSAGPGSVGELDSLVVCRYEPAGSAPVSSLAPKAQAP